MVLPLLQTTTTRWLTVLSDPWHPSGKYSRNKDTTYSFSPSQITNIRTRSRLSSAIRVYLCRCRWILLLSFQSHPLWTNCFPTLNWILSTLITPSCSVRPRPARQQISTFHSYLHFTL